MGSSTLDARRGEIDAAIHRLRSGGTDAPVFYAERDERDAALSQVARHWGGDEAEPYDGATGTAYWEAIPPNDPLWRAAAMLLGWNRSAYSDPTCPHGYAVEQVGPRQALGEALVELLVSIDQAEGETHAGGGLLYTGVCRARTALTDVHLALDDWFDAVKDINTH